MKVLLCHALDIQAAVMRQFLGNVPGIETIDMAVGVDAISRAILDGEHDVCIMGSQSLSIVPDVLARVEGRCKVPHKRVIVTPVTTAERLFQGWRYGFNHVINVGLMQGSVYEQLDSVVKGEKDLAREPSMMAAREWLFKHNVAWVAHDETDLEILMELVEGRSNEEISRNVGIAVQTVRNRISRLMRESGAQNRTQLALKMVR